MKLESIFLNQDFTLKLGDFSLYQNVEDRQNLTEVHGARPYMAPEMFSPEGYQGQAADLFSMGVVLHSLIYGTPPFEEAQDKYHRSMIKKRNQAFKKGLKIRIVDDLICSMLEPKVGKRLTFAQISRHEWFQDMR